MYICKSRQKFDYQRIERKQHSRDFVILKWNARKRTQQCIWQTPHFFAVVVIICLFVCSFCMNGTMSLDIFLQRFFFLYFPNSFSCVHFCVGVFVCVRVFNTSLFLHKLNQKIYNMWCHCVHWLIQIENIRFHTNSCIRLPTTECTNHVKWNYKKTKKKRKQNKFNLCLSRFLFINLNN